ncbi:hypothetical protein [Aneurinibacillus tyrosinisolvens]|nr:hypothetical protein [Aneurinibacillus tyrosinisolvens]
MVANLIQFVQDILQSVVDFVSSLLTITGDVLQEVADAFIHFLQTLI